MENYNKVKINNNSKKSLIYKFKLFFNQEFFKNHIVLWLLIFNFLANLTNWIILAIFINKTQRNIILHYNVYFGVDNLGNWKQSFLAPAIGLFLFLVNFSLAFFFYKNRERIASYSLLLASVIIQINLIISSVSVILINY
ncbi:MAG: hypothetical protein US30_C0004G0119 [Candidatus Moranbacteria bacterium GW2011_GWF2_36_839]|nr:MAG: hypothetical protein US27_C0002G0122 [Candidatus Moranbacteria bacterium GW2011_GWF1_36_78]KKQ17375.1 MAG: hypothetical protein US30_C0004G0119 [Candidatus Moranbacteria bacterium GW2011_GWF2_36_839]HAT73783.1 hypothetical protein [Candidatus Moranbacteria bacterium]HBY11074.1 hypothetical protein [Candidatus Moranbacteria bacterium]